MLPSPALSAALRLHTHFSVPKQPGSRLGSSCAGVDRANTPGSLLRCTRCASELRCFFIVGAFVSLVLMLLSLRNDTFRMISESRPQEAAGIPRPQTLDPKVSSSLPWGTVGATGDLGCRV